VVAENGGERPSDRYENAAGTLDGDLSPAPGDAIELEFAAGDSRAIRAFADDHGRAHHLSVTDLENLVFAASELTANSVQHGGGHGRIVAWGGAGSAVLEVRDAGLIRDPLVGRVRPGLDEGARGRGLWLIEQLCDLVQIRSGPEGTVVRVHTGATGSRACAPS
jgi:anti-sigma regulatory factor (Ser/Thr protein kinase)